MDLVVHQGSIIETQVEVIVNSANSRGTMAGGVAAVLRKSAGIQVESEAMEQAPLPVGGAVLTSAGKLRESRGIQAIIHACVTGRPGEPAEPENVYKCTMAALRLAQEKGYSSIALPGIGTGGGAVSPEEAARLMIAACRDIPSGTLELVVLADVANAMIDAWRGSIEMGERI